MRHLAPGWPSRGEFGAAPSGKGLLGWDFDDPLLHGIVSLQQVTCSLKDGTTLLLVHVLREEGEHLCCRIAEEALSDLRADIRHLERVSMADGLMRRGPCILEGLVQEVGIVIFKRDHFGDEWARGDGR